MYNSKRKSGLKIAIQNTLFKLMKTPRKIIKTRELSTYFRAKNGRKERAAKILTAKLYFCRESNNLESCNEVTIYTSLVMNELPFAYL